MPKTWSQKGPIHPKNSSSEVASLTCFCGGAGGRPGMSPTCTTCLWHSQIAERMLVRQVSAQGLGVIRLRCNKLGLRLHPFIDADSSFRYAVENDTFMRIFLSASELSDWLNQVEASFHSEKY